MLERPVLFNVSNYIRASNSHGFLQKKIVTHCVRGLVISCYIPYTLRYIVSLSDLSLGIGQAWLLVPLAGAVSGIPKLQYFCRTEQLCCCTFCSVNLFLHTPHLPYLTVLYLTTTFQPTLFNKLDNLFLMTVQLQILSEAISFVCIFYKKILFTWLQVCSQDCWNRILALLCLSVSPSFLR